MPATLRRQLRQADIQCPAGLQVGDACVICRIEGSEIDGHEDPASIENFCAGDHTQCPSWRAEKEATWEGQTLQLEKKLPTPTRMEPGALTSQTAGDSPR